MPAAGIPKSPYCLPDNHLAIRNRTIGFNFHTIGVNQMIANPPPSYLPRKAGGQHTTQRKGGHQRLEKYIDNRGEAQPLPVFRQNLGNHNLTRQTFDHG